MLTSLWKDGEAAAESFFFVCLFLEKASLLIFNDTFAKINPIFKQCSLFSLVVFYI